MNEIDINTISNFYRYFYFCVSKSEYTLDFRSTEKKCVHSFLMKIQDWSPDSLWNYFCFAFNYYEGLDTNRGRNNIPIMWIVGQKMWGIYCERDRERSSYFISRFIEKYRLRKSDLINIERLAEVDFKEIDKRERERFKNNPDRQLIHCWEMGINVIGSCVLCKNIEQCKNLRK